MLNCLAVVTMLRKNVFVAWITKTFSIDSTTRSNNEKFEKISETALFIKFMFLLASISLEPGWSSALCTQTKLIV